MRNALSSFLHHTGTETDKFCVILTTNVKDILDRAVVDRIDEQFEFPLPPKPERYEMLKMFFEEHILTPTKRGRGIVVDPKVDDAYLQQLAETTDGFSGRQLSKLVMAMQAAAFGSGTNNLTRGVADAVVEWTLANRTSMSSSSSSSSTQNHSLSG
eukprot:GHVU01218589.1.p1 GENE.GHVU01218589.1~~GHVU01218589.1.p1  ORF type:complete len:168 (-),score=41.20 GHVU01218589.1:106-573(-)